MKIPYSYLDRQFDAVETEAIFVKLRTLVAMGDFTIGRPVIEFEQRLGDLLGVKHVIGTNTGTNALILGLKALGVGPGDEVITQVNTFYATVGAIVAVGARPVFVDVDDHLAMNDRLIEASITPHTKAILPVWYTGLPPNLTMITEIANRHHISIVEDACPALGGAYNGKPAGTFGDTAAFSMHPLKSLNVWGDGGAVVTNNDTISDWLRLYRNHGMRSRDEISIWGVNERLQTIQAVVATHLLDRVTPWVTRRIEIAERIERELADVPEISLPHRPLNRKSSIHLYILRVQRRDELIRYLADRGVEAKIHYPIPLHLQVAARELGYKRGDFPVAEAQAKEILTLPLHQFLSHGEVAYMIDCMRKFYDR